MPCFRAGLQRLVEHETGVDPTIVSIPFGRRRRTDPLAVLSAREREVLGLVGEGLSTGPSQRLSVRAVEQERSGLLTERVAASEGADPRCSRRVHPRLRCRVASWWPADRTGAAA